MLGAIARLAQHMAAFPVTQAGRPLHYPFRGLLSVHSRFGLHARKVTQGDPLHRSAYNGHSLAIAPIATGWSDQLPGGNLTH